MATTHVPDTSDTARDLTVVRDASGLVALRTGRLRAGRGKLRLELPGLDIHESRQLADRLTTLQNECGCSIGAALAYPAAFAAVIWCVVNPPVGAGVIGNRIVVSLAAIFIAGMLGKVIGIARARLAMRAEIDALRRRLRDRTIPDENESVSRDRSSISRSC
jgi:hypothetical protein